MMLFDSPSGPGGADAPIVIVPPKPDALLSHHDEFSYSNLYCYDYSYGGGPADCGGASTAGGGGAPSVASSAPPSSLASASSTTLNSSFTSTSTRDHQRSTASFDSSAFDSVRPRNSTGSFGGIQQQQQQPTLRESSGGAITRDPRNGAFTFQVHAEYDLLLHVQKDLDRHRKNCNNKNEEQSTGEDESVRLSGLIMRSVDEYCLQKQWMYHIGSEKGMAIGLFLREGAERFYGILKRSGERKKFVCVELGTYCGYSALVLASTLCKYVQELRQQKLIERLSLSDITADDEEEEVPFEFHVYTTEVSTKLLNVAQSVFRLAKMEARITPILVSGDDTKGKSSSAALAEMLRNEHGIENIDFLLLDHAKDRYLRDLQALESARLVKAGSYVSADNVVFNRLDAYRDHMHRLGLGGVAESRLEEMNLEYSNNLKDGMEMTVYLKDPPVAD